MTACAIFLSGVLVVAMLWVVLGMTLYAIAGEPGLDAVSDTVLLSVLGCLLLLLPVFVGAWRLSRTVDTQAHRHCLVFGFVALALIGLPALMSGRLSISWQATPYYVAIVPTALLGGLIGRRTRRPEATPP